MVLTYLFEKSKTGKSDSKKESGFFIVMKEIRRTDIRID